jgi:hypothetical protein
MRGIPFQKGDSRINRRGRPRRESRLEAFRKRLVKALKATDELGVRELDGIIRTAIRQAKAGDGDARRFLIEYAFGRPPKAVEISGLEGGPVVGAVGITQEGLDALERLIMGDDCEPLPSVTMLTQQLTRCGEPPTKDKPTPDLTEVTEEPKQEPIFEVVP